MSSFGRNVLMVAGSTACSQAVMAALLPLLTRIYSPEDFGVSAAFFAVGGILAVIPAGRYEMGIAVPQEDGEAWTLLAFVARLCLGFAALGSVVLILWVPKSLNPVGPCVHLLPVYVASTTYNVAIAYWLARRGEFAWISLSRLTYVSTVLVLQTVLGLTAGGPGLVAGMVAGTVVLSGVGGWKAWRTRPAASSARPSLRQVARRHYRSPCYLLPAHAINSFATNVPVLFLNAWFGSAVAGHFSLAMRLLEAPLQLVGQSIGQVFYPEAARQYALRGECVALFRKVAKRLFWVGGAGAVGVSLAAPWLITSLLGSEWRQGARIIQVLAPFLLPRLIASPLGTMALVAGKQLVDLLWQILALLLVVAGFSVGLVFENWMLSVVGYGCGVATAFLVCLLLCYRFACGAAVSLGHNVSRESALCRGRRLAASR